jgi:O-antigen ligase
MQHPLFGIGVGNFKVAAAANAEEKQEHADWLETHNSFTQISSEAGLPALIVYVLAIGFSVSSLIRTYRATRARPELADMSHLAFAVLLSIGMTFVNANFASVAYQIYFPLLCGIAVAVTHIGDKALKAASYPAHKPGQVKSTPQPGSLIMPDNFGVRRDKVIS